MRAHDFVVIGSGGGGGTIAWMLAKAGHDVLLLEQGSDIAVQAESPLGPPTPFVELRGFNAQLHDEYRFRLERPDPKRRLRGAYNTFRRTNRESARPLAGMGGFTASVLGGGSLLWGTWTYRALPIDFRLRQHFRELQQLDLLEKDWGYSIPDWPISYAAIEPYYDITEAVFAVCGDRKAVNSAVQQTDWYQTFKDRPHFSGAGNWEPQLPFPGSPYPMTPIGYYFFDAMEQVGLNPFVLPNSLVSPESGPYNTRKALERAIDAWPVAKRPEFWKQKSATLWSDRSRDPCNLCGYCGEFLCWGHRAPKSGTRPTFLRELADCSNATIRTDAPAFEILYDSRTRRATGMRFLDIRNPDDAQVEQVAAKHVIVSCGAVQSARLLLMSGPPGGLGNKYDQLGRNVTFHMFGMGARALLPPRFQGQLHAEFGHTGSIASYDYYLVEDRRQSAPAHLRGKWCKAGTLASAAKKNPLENADAYITRSSIPKEERFGELLLKGLEPYTRTVEVRLTGDDLPMPQNRVDLDPSHVDEYGLPVARITRSFGPHERWMHEVMADKLRDIFRPYMRPRHLREDDVKVSPGIPDLIGDHQFGTCRMGDDPTQSVLDENCRMHEVPNVFVVDSSFMPTGLGLNPMQTIVANALRVGTWIVEACRTGRDM